MVDGLGLHSLPLFALAVLVLNATPGVDMLLTVGRTLAGGPRAGLAAAAGITAGSVVHVLAAAFGLAALLAVSSTAFMAIKWAGAAYLLWLAAGMLRAAWRPVRVDARPAEATSVTSPARWPTHAPGTRHRQPVPTTNRRATQGDCHLRNPPHQRLRVSAIAKNETRPTTNQ